MVAARPHDLRGGHKLSLLSLVPIEVEQKDEQASNSIQHILESCLVEVRVPLMLYLIIRGPPDRYPSGLLPFIPRLQRETIPRYDHFESRYLRQVANNDFSIWEYWGTSLSY